MKVLISIFLFSVLISTSAFGRPIWQARCQFGERALTLVEVKGSWAWAVKCYPHMKMFYEALVKNARGRLPSLVFEKTVSGKKVFFYPPLNPAKSCQSIPKEAKLAGICLP